MRSNYRWIRRKKRQIIWQISQLLEWNSPSRKTKTKTVITYPQMILKMLKFANSETYQNKKKSKTISKRISMYCSKMPENTKMTMLERSQLNRFKKLSKSRKFQTPLWKIRSRSLEMEFIASFGFNPGCSWLWEYVQFLQLRRCAL